MGRLDNFEPVLFEFNSEAQERRDKNILVITKLGTVLTVTFITMFILEIILQIEVMKVPIQIIFLVLFISLIVSFLVAEYSKSSKLLYEFLMPKIVEDYEKEKGILLNYTSEVKRDKELNPKGGIFTKAAGNTVKFRLSGSLDGVPFTMDQSYIYMSNGKTTTVYLNGMYLYFGIVEPNYVQVRDRWKPSLKGVKFHRDDNNKHVFSPEGCVVNTKYIELFDYLKTIRGVDQVYVSANDSGLHIALDKFQFKKPYQLTKENYEELVQQLDTLLSIKLYIKTNILDA